MNLPLFLILALGAAGVLFLIMSFLDKRAVEDELRRKEQRHWKLTVLRRAGVQRISTPYGNYPITQASEADLNEAIKALRRQRVLRVAG